jgi:hypothetical protein
MRALHKARKTYGYGLFIHRHVVDKSSCDCVAHHFGWPHQPQVFFLQRIIDPYASLKLKKITLNTKTKQNVTYHWGRAYRQVKLLFLSLQLR